MIMKYFTTI